MKNGYFVSDDAVTAVAKCMDKTNKNEETRKRAGRSHPNRYSVRWTED